ncbi:hypothetical protein BDD12DRAFT_801509 [Trichophaea hybrida]|nr:hypothetical protein BDD12DRAFT_801509 [Trichophaea hybrida]
MATSQSPRGRRDPAKNPEKDPEKDSENNPVKDPKKDPLNDTEETICIFNQDAGQGSNCSYKYAADEDASEANQTITKKISKESGITTATHGMDQFWTTYDDIIVQPIWK